MLAVPMSHVTGVIALIDTMVYCAGALVIMPAFKATDFIDLAARHRITFSLIVPAMFNLCLLAPNFDGADLSAWRVSGYGGAIMPEVTLERIAQKLPRLKLINCYGSTETTSPAVFMPPEEAIARKEYVGPDGSVRTHHRHGRGGARGSLRHAGRSLHRRRDGRARIFQQSRSHRARVQGRLLEVGRPRHHGREGLPAGSSTGSRT